MRELNRRSDWKGLLQTLGHLTLIVLTGALAWQVQDRLYLLLPTLLAYGTFYIFLLNATHELCHNTVFRTQFLNDFFLRLFCFLGWRSHIHFWTSHAEHHKYTLHPPDDLEVVLPAKLTLKNFIQLGFVDPWTLCSTLKTHLEHSLGVIRGEWPEHLFPPDAVDKRRRLFWWARFYWWDTGRWWESLYTTDCGCCRFLRPAAYFTAAGCAIYATARSMLACRTTCPIFACARARSC